MMILKLFGTRERDLVFGEQDWVTDPIQKNYTLTLDLGRMKVRGATQFILFMLQGSRYVYLSEGSEAVEGSILQYNSHFRFAGKVKVR